MLWGQFCEMFQSCSAVRKNQSLHLRSLIMSLKQCHSTRSLASSFLEIIFNQLCLSPRAILYDWGWTSYSGRVEHGFEMDWWNGINWVRELTAVIFDKNKMVDKTCRLLDGKEASDFIVSMDTFIFDCDGKRRKCLKSRFVCNFKEVMHLSL